MFNPRLTDKDDRIRDFSGYLEKPAVRFSEVCLPTVKPQFEMIAAFLKGDSAFEEWGCEPPRGVMLYGPPGTGKTQLARALAGEIKCPFYNVPSTAFLNLWYGNTEANLRNFFHQAASHSDGCVIFIDEFDDLGSRRGGPELSYEDGGHRRVVGCLLELMDGFRQSGERLVVLAATNRLDIIDPAFLRPGRFDYIIQVPRPGVNELTEILLIHLRQAEAKASHHNLLAPELRKIVHGGIPLDNPQTMDPALVFLTDKAARHKLVGADIREIVRRATFDRATQAVHGQKNLPPLGTNDLQKQLDELIRQRDLQNEEKGPAVSRSRVTLN